MNLKDTYNKIAKDWALDHPGDTWWIEGVDKYLSYLPSQGSILDVGCGPGQKTQYLVSKGFEVVGADFSEKMVELAKEANPNIRFLVKNIKEPLGMNLSFDGVFAQAVLLHIPKQEIVKVMGNILEPLKSNGYIYISVKQRRENAPEEEMVKESDYGYEYERFFSYFTLREIKKYLTDAGTEVVYEKVVLNGNTRWIQVIAKKML